MIKNDANFKYYNKYVRTVFIEIIVCHFLALINEEF